MHKILIAGYPEKTRNYEEALLSAGFLPTTSLNTSPEYLEKFDGLLLPGGADIAPELFHQKNLGSRNIDKILDLTQFSILSHFVNEKKPVLGICKGMQVINVFFEGDMVQHLSSATSHSQINDCDQIHQTIIENNSFLSALYGDSAMVNSAHHQSIGLPGKNLTIIQYSKDYVPEALVHDTLPIIAVQWHPERMCCNHKREDTVDGALIFQYFKTLFPSSKG